jgi:hypothetical protein
MPYLRKTTPQFVEEAQRVHGEKFDYSRNHGDRFLILS